MPIFKAGDVFRGLALDRFLAAGAHGEVYAAHSVATGAPFALKVVKLADRQSRVNVERALAAARGAFAVEHPNVVTVHDVGLEPDGSVYLVMELLRGCSVDALLRWGRVSAVFAPVDRDRGGEGARGGARGGHRPPRRQAREPLPGERRAGPHGGQGPRLHDRQGLRRRRQHDVGPGGAGHAGLPLPRARLGGHAARRHGRLRAGDDAVGDPRRLPSLPGRAGRPRRAAPAAARRHAAAALAGRGPPAERRLRRPARRREERGHALPGHGGDDGRARQAARVARPAGARGAPDAPRARGAAADPRRREPLRRAAGVGRRTRRPRSTWRRI